MVRKKLRRIWNWLRGKRILLTDPKRGRVMVRTGRNSKNRDNGGQWYVVSYDVASGPPPLPRCSRGRLDRPDSRLAAERRTGQAHTIARDWYRLRHGPLPQGHDLDLVCVSDPNDRTLPPQMMRYRPNEVFELEHPWLSTAYSGPSFRSYFGTWYGSGTMTENHIMDFETFWHVRPGALHLPKWGASWR